MVTASLRTGRGTGEAAPSEPQQGPEHVQGLHVQNDQQLPGLTAQPTATLGNEPKCKTLNGKLYQVLKLSSKVLSHVC